MWAQGGFLGFACGESHGSRFFHFQRRADPRIASQRGLSFAGHGFGGGALLQLRTATKKAGGSSANGRDSLPKHLGLKLSDGQQAKVGAMIYKQRGTRLMPGFGVRAGRDGSLHAELPGVVRYETDKRTGRQSVSIQARVQRRRARVAGTPAEDALRRTGMLHCSADQRRHPGGHYEAVGS